jgi:hypothetical protein
MDSKLCPKCDQTKPVSEFWKNRSTKDGLQPYCKPCFLPYSTAWRKKNPDKERAAERRRRVENPEPALARERRYRESHREECSACSRDYRTRHPDETRALRQRWYDGHRDQISAYMFVHGLRHKYGLSIEDYEAMYERQGGKCALCGHPDRLCVDHDHQTGRVRGLLCYLCNTALGRLVGDDPVRLDAIRDYLTIVP